VQQRPVTPEFFASELTPDDVGDVSELPALLDQIDGEAASLTADGAYDGVPLSPHVTPKQL
jgi:hypothetical protein